MDTRREAFEAAMDAAQACTACSAVAVLLLDDERRLRFMAWRNLSDGYRARVEAFGPLVPDREKPRPIFLQRVDQDDAYRINWDLLRAERIVGMAFYPIVQGSDILGKLTVYYDHDHRSTEEEIAHLSALAGQLGARLAAC